MPVADDSEGQVRVATSRGLRRIAQFVLAGSLAVLPVAGLTPPAHAATTMELESCFLDQINAARAINGAAALELSPDLSEYGRSHSTTMAAAGFLFHSGSEQLEPVLPTGWQAWGENVGYATGSESCDWLFEAFWESPGHRDALLNPIFDLAG
ncbi:MAG: CAP domain-containing protein, partial [Acidimicrobiia bacterium]